MEILCKNYGRIDGLWFDGNWSKPEADWKEMDFSQCGEMLTVRFTVQRSGMSFCVRVAVAELERSGLDDL